MLKTHKKINQNIAIPFIVASLLVSSFAAIMQIYNVSVANAASCGDVFAPLPSYIKDAVSSNKADYVTVSKETGVPWQLFAAIHYRETGFSHSNPGNGYGLFQFTPSSYKPGAVSHSDFMKQLRDLAKKIQTDYVFKNSLSPASIKTRKLTSNEKNSALVKNVLFSYNGRASVYAKQASKYGYSSSATPYEGSPYVMNMFDCNRSSMGIITHDYGGIDGKDTRYGAFTLYARLVSDSYWKGLQSDKTGTFNFERLSGRSPSVLPTTSTSLASYTKTISSNGKIYTFYYDAAGKTLRLAYWNGNKWSTQILDGAGSNTSGSLNHDVGKGIDATVRQGNVQLYYYDATSGDLRHGWLRGSTWKLETLDGSKGSLGGKEFNVGRYPKVMLDNKNRIQLYYYDAGSGSIRHAWWPGDGRWHFENFDGVKGSIGKSTSDMGRAISGFIYKDNQIQLYYYNATSGSIRHAWWPGDGRWHFENLDGVEGSIVGKTSNVGSSITANYYDGDIQLFYFDKSNGELRHTWWPGDGRWHDESFDGNNPPHSIVGNYINAGKQITTVVFKHRLYVFYYDDASVFNGDRTSAWRVAYWNNGAWNALTLDGGSPNLSGSSDPVGGQITAASYNGNYLEVMYKDSTGGLKHAWFKE